MFLGIAASSCQNIAAAMTLLVIHVCLVTMRIQIIRFHSFSNPAKHFSKKRRSVTRNGIPEHSVALNVC